MKNVYWCPQCDEGYQADGDVGCPKCGDGSKADDKHSEDDSDGMIGAAILASGGVSLVLGFILGFLVRGCA
jgi:hypothetical protein